MLLIKRYPNRKLYDTKNNRYINLDGIAELIRQDIDLQIIDNASGADLTALTMTQVILDQGKKMGGFLPHTFLTSLIQTGNEKLHSLKRSIPSQLLIKSQVDEEIKKRIEKIVSTGDLSEEMGKWLNEKLSVDGVNNDFTDSFTDNQLELILEDQNIPTRQDIDSLYGKLETLSKKIDSLRDAKLQEKI